MTRAPLRGLFVIGTDTGVGKTLVAAALLRQARRFGLLPVPFKPVETGCDPDPLDALALRRAALSAVSIAEICPHALRMPAAPALAAAAENVRVDIDDLVERAGSLASRGDLLVVEGAGGLLVPYADATTTADLAARLGLPVLIVARTGLGTVNHTALTVREAERAGLVIAGLLLNKTTASPDPHEPFNGQLIEAVTGKRPLATLPYFSAETRADPDRLADAVASAVERDDLARLLGAASGG